MGFAICRSKTFGLPCCSKASLAGLGAAASTQSRELQVRKPRRTTKRGRCSILLWDIRVGPATVSQLVIVLLVRWQSATVGAGRSDSVGTKNRLNWPAHCRCVQRRLAPPPSFMAARIASDVASLMGKTNLRAEAGSLEATGWP
jgi:hypothetical protein